MSFFFSCSGFACVYLATTVPKNCTLKVSLRAQHGCYRAAPVGHNAITSISSLSLWSLLVFPVQTCIMSIWTH